jgi:hypothetical protein
LRIIPLKEPFTPICDSIVLMNNLAIGKLENFEAKISSEYKKVYNEKVQELDNKTYFKLSILIGYFEAYRSRPCDENAYKDYIQNLNQIRETLFNLDNLNSDIDKIIKGKGISGTSPTDLINRVSKFLNMN